MCIFEALIHRQQSGKKGIGESPA
jgi:hypothetical protein